MSAFTWGDTVRVKTGAPPDKHPGQLAAVVGIREIQTEAQARQFDAPIGAKLYLIEISDGSSFEIPEALIERHDQPPH